MADRDYTVLSIRPVRDLDATGAAVEAEEITYQGPNNITGRVRSATADATPAYVDQLIRADLDRKQAIHQLGTGSG